MNNNYEQNEKKNFQGDKGFSINKSSSLEMWYCHPESEDKDGASMIKITFSLRTQQISFRFGQLQDRFGTFGCINLILNSSFTDSISDTIPIQ